MVTLSEVAKIAGVSRSAVSKAILGGGGKTTKVSEDNIKRIREIARQLGYRPNLLAQRLANKQHDIIGVIIDSQCCGLYNNIMSSIEGLTFAAGLRLQVGLVHDNFEAICKYVDDLHGYGIDDVICLAHYYEFAEQIPPLFRSFRNVLFISKPMTEEPFSFISPDYYGNFIEATEYLLELGHRRIVFAKTAYKTIDAESREQAYRDAHRKFGVPVNEAFIDRRPFGEINTKEQMSAFLDGILPLKPDALILGNPVAINWCLRLLEERGFSIPRDISILGMDHWSGCEAMRPAITVIDNNYQEIAIRAVKVICSRAGTENISPEQEFVRGNLIIGESCRNRCSE